MADGAPDYPLAGLKVLDLSRVLAGPFAGRMLSDLGYVVGPIALGLAADLAGANAALAATAVLLTAVALLFARLAPETYRAARF